MSPDRIMILAGEASGDAHAAEFVVHLKRRQPDIQVCGMGGAAMRQSGVEVFFDSASIAVVGLVEVLRHWGEIKRAMNLVKQRLEEDRPTLLVLVDYPEFNLKMAKFAKSLGIRVLFYISPQVWAWRPKRIHKIGRLIDHMAVIFKFETKYYKKANIPVTFVGHPLIGKVNLSIESSSARAKLDIASEQRVIGLFPGSRQSEIERLLPIMLESARQMLRQQPDLRFILPVASTLNYDQIVDQSKKSGLDQQITVSREDIHQVIASCDAIISCSGTVTLEIALLKVPMCIVYKMSPISYFIMSRLITIPHIGLVNIVADTGVVKELLQQDASPEKISAEAFKLINDTHYREQIQVGLQQVHDNLGDGGGSKNMANLVLAQIAQANQMKVSAK